MFNNTTAAHGDDALWTKNSGIGQAAVIDELIAEFSSSQMKLTETRSILLISMYVPLFLTAAIANAVVIVVVIKYHYMRRWNIMFSLFFSFHSFRPSVLCIRMPLQNITVTSIGVYWPVCCFAYKVADIYGTKLFFFPTAFQVQQSYIRFENY